MLKSIDLEKLENLASAATRGPWTYCSNEDQLGEYVCELTRGDGEKSDFSVGTRNDWGQMKNPEWNAMFIAAANPYVVLTLVAELKALRAAAAPAGDLNPVLDVMRNTGLSIDGDNAYKRDLLDCVVGALATGAQNSNPPPAGHWGQRFWDIGREERASSDQLLKALTALTQVAGECEQIASNYSGTIDGIFEHGGDDHEDPSCAIFHRLYYAMFDARAAIKKATT